jgi:hypothetical protein
VRSAAGACLLTRLYSIGLRSPATVGDSFLRRPRAPHAVDEIRVSTIVDQLRFDDREELFNAIRRLKRDLALKTVEDYGALKSGMA